MQRKFSESKIEMRTHSPREKVDSVLKHLFAQSYLSIVKIIVTFDY